MQLIKVFLFVCFLLTSIFPQQFTNWKNFANMKAVADVHFSGGNIWAATDGGVFKFSPADNSFRTLTKADGLQGITLTSITSDPNGRIWFGSNRGILDVFDETTDNFRVILDIANSNQVNKRINYLVNISDTIIVSTDFGVSLIDANSFLFFDTFFKFGNFSTNTRVNYANKYGLFYVCTDEGIAIQKPEATNLSAPESWNVFTTSDGLPSNKVLKAVVFQGEIIAATEKGFAKFNGTNWEPFISPFDNKLIPDMNVSGDSLFFIAENKLFLYNNGIISELLNPENGLSRFERNNDGSFAGATSGGAAYITTDLNVSYLIPNGPASNQFPSIAVDNKGVFWSASGKDNTGVGFYRFDKSTWTNFNVENTPQLPDDDIYRVFTSSDGFTYFGTWGYGFIKTDGKIFEVFNRENSGMQGIPENPDFLVVTGFGKDSKQNLWILNFAAVDRRTLSMLTPDSTWHHFIIPAAQNRFLAQHFNLAVDPYDTKWFSSGDNDRQGLFYFNEMKTDDVSDDRSEFISSANGLNTNDVRAVVVDKRGDVWVGTALGVNVISNTSSVTSSGGALLRVSSVFSLRQQSINAIAVDPLNQKWVGTNQGLLLVNSDGSRLIAALDSKNSPLLSDRIISLAIDADAGIVYVGTDKGLSSFETPFTKPKESFDKLFVYPNPYVVSDGANLLTIDGLIKDTDIKILTIDGSLVSEFSSPGGRTAFWDGRDMDGNIVNSGVYLIVAFDREGNNVITGKVAVLKK